MTFTTWLAPLAGERSLRGDFAFDFLTSIDPWWPSDPPSAEALREVLEKAPLYRNNRPFLLAAIRTFRAFQRNPDRLPKRR